MRINDKYLDYTSMINFYYHMEIMSRSIIISIPYYIYNNLCYNIHAGIRIHMFTKNKQHYFICG